MVEFIPLYEPLESRIFRISGVFNLTPKASLGVLVIGALQAFNACISFKLRVLYFRKAFNVF